MLKDVFSYEVFKSSLEICISPEKPRTFSRISVLNPLTMAIASIITARPSMIPRIAIRTISFEKVLFELNVIRFAMKRGKFNP